jgi:thiol-disulfide isomerase/thioredoxin
MIADDLPEAAHRSAEHGDALLDEHTRDPVDRGRLGRTRHDLLQSLETDEVHAPRCYHPRMRMALVGCLLLASCKREDAAPPPSASVVQQHAERPAPASPLTGVLVSDAAGKPLPIADRMREVTVLAFWASWCGPCQAEMPLVDRYAASEQDARIAVIAVNIDEQRQEGVEAVAQRHFQLPVVFDPDEHTYEALFHTQDAEIPAIAVVSRDGVATENGFDDDLTDVQHIAHFRELAHAHLH